MRAFIASLSSILTLDKNMKDGFKPDIQKIIIPLYQREYKWESEMIETLLFDIDNSTKFLGNIILDEKEDRYEIIDGQQRLTTCFLILACVFNYYSDHQREQNNINRLLKPTGEFIFQNYSIPDFLMLSTENKYIIGASKSTDIYEQKDSFIKAFKTIENYLKEIEFTKLKKFCAKLESCPFLVLINENKAPFTTYSVEELFLDINEKSKPLDVEDVFKGHCFKNFDSSSHEELKDKWKNFKEKVMKMRSLGFSDVNEYIYVYLLEMAKDDLPKNLIISGKHYLQDKTEDETNQLLVDMTEYAATILTFQHDISRTNYRFENICPASANHIQDHNILRQICKLMLGTNNEPLYPKIPLFTLLFYLNKSKEVREIISHKQFLSLLSNLYVYIGMFGIKQGRKSKKNIDHTIKYFIDEKSELSVSEKVTGVVKAARDLRKNIMSDLQLTTKYDEWICYFLYSVIDFFDASESAMRNLYNLVPDTTIEHFLVTENKKIYWKHSDGTILRFKIEDNTLYKKAIKSLSNYILVDKQLNGDILCNYDIIEKIKLVREWFNVRKQKIPRHIEIVINEIESFQHYQELVKLKDDNETNEDIIKKKYCIFLEEYFADDNSMEFSKEIQQGLINSFKQ